MNDSQIVFFRPGFSRNILVVDLSLWGKYSRDSLPDTAMYLFGLLGSLKSCSHLTLPVIFRPGFS